MTITTGSAGTGKHVYDYDVPRHPGANGLVALTGQQAAAEASARRRADEGLAESAHVLQKVVAS